MKFYFLKLLIFFYLALISTLSAHDKKKKSIKSHEHGVGILNLSQDENILLPSSSAECNLEDSSVKVNNEGDHSEFLTSYKFNCSSISTLKMIYIKYFKVFPDCYKTNIKIFGKNKKSAYVINKSKKFISVKGHF